MVWWDMDTCLLPHGYDPRRLAPRIHTELKNLGYNGPFTIIAIGNLDGIPIEFLQELASSGVVIKHGSYGNNSILRDIIHFEEKVGETPVTVMVISESFVLDLVAETFCEHEGGYNYLLAYPPFLPPEEPHPSSLVVCGEWLWDRASLLKDSGSDEGSARLSKDSKFSCLTCYDSASTFEDFTEHLKSSQHVDIVAQLSKDREKMFLFLAKEEEEKRMKNKVKKKQPKAKRLKTRGEYIAQGV